MSESFDKIKPQLESLLAESAELRREELDMVREMVSFCSQGRGNMEVYWLLLRDVHAAHTALSHRVSLFNGQELFRLQEELGQSKQIIEQLGKDNSRLETANEALQAEVILLNQKVAGLEKLLKPLPTYIQKIKNILLNVEGRDADLKQVAEAFWEGDRKSNKDSYSQKLEEDISSVRKSLKKLDDSIHLACDLTDSN